MPDAPKPVLDYVSAGSAKPGRQRWHRAVVIAGLAAVALVGVLLVLPFGFAVVEGTGQSAVCCTVPAVLGLLCVRIGCRGLYDLLGGSSPTR